MGTRSSAPALAKPCMRSGVSLSRCGSSQPRPPPVMPCSSDCQACSKLAARALRPSKCLPAKASAIFARASSRCSAWAWLRKRKASCNAVKGSAASCGRSGNNRGIRSRVSRSPARASGDVHKPCSNSASRASAPCERHTSAATSSSNSRWLPIISGASNACPVCKACSVSTRAQKPWMVKTAARSVSCSARRSRACRLAASSTASCRCRMRRVKAASGCSSTATGWPCSSASLIAAASARRLRRRARSSWVAASVKVTARIWPRLRPRSTTSRVTSVARVKVLPVPALASISCRPSRSMSR